MQQRELPNLKRCAIVQFEARHEEILPSMILACNRLGYRPEVLLHRGCRRMRGDIFQNFPSLDANIRYMALSSEDGIEAAGSHLDETDPEFVIIASFGRARVGNWAEAYKKPKIAVIHNVDQLFGIAELSAQLTSSSMRFLTLAPHVALEIADRTNGRLSDNTGVIEPVVWTDAEPAVTVPASPRRVAIPGAVSLRTRDYLGLVEALKNKPGDFENLHFVVASGGGSREEVERAVASAGLERCISFLPLNQQGQVPHDIYLGAMGAADLIHPLIPSDFGKYRRIKITSSIPTSIGFAKPAVLDRWTSLCYRVPGVISDRSMQSALKALSETPNHVLAEISSKLNERRCEALAAGARELERLIQSF